ncbi:hypothetical protein EVAR_100608_1 [Eumeta japonica]|uniref:Uncharacterized protein n=1 Tax=Eumeta variegata TaxID=151549 RepID=A0A4C1ZD22_EUMVA|nr:hypothetical protein EVAR_100608_1 [Eumeta japonica]
MDLNFNRCVPTFYGTKYDLYIAPKHKTLGACWSTLVSVGRGPHCPGDYPMWRNCIPERAKLHCLTDDRELEVLNISSWHYVSIAGFITLPLRCRGRRGRSHSPEATA